MKKQNGHGLSMAVLHDEVLNMKQETINKAWIRKLGSGWKMGEPVTVDLPDDYIINLKRSPNHPGGGSVGYFPSEDAEYKKELMIAKPINGKLLLLMDGAYEKAEVYIGDDLVDYHPYGYTARICDLTDFVTEGNNSLKIRVSSRHPASRWYTGGGLYREVSLLHSTGKIYIHPWKVFISTQQDDDCAIVKAQLSVTNEYDHEVSGKVFLDILDSNDDYKATDAVLKNQVISVRLKPGDNLINTVMLLRNPRLWDVDDPNLYQMKIDVKTSFCNDSHIQTFGVRDITINAEDGFIINGKSIKLRGGCIHHDNGFLGAAAFPDSEERKIRLLKNAGFNAIRTAHNPPSSSLLDACDKLGMLVLDESFDCWRLGKTSMDYHREFENWWKIDVTAFVLRDRNHPCVFCYSIGNEIMEFGGNSDGVLWGKRQADLVRTLDPSRPVTSGINMACGRPSDHFKDMDYQEMAYDMAHSTGEYDGIDLWGNATYKNIENLDIAGYNYMYSRYKEDHKRYPDRVIMGTETMPFYVWENTMAVNENSHVIGDFVWVAMDNLGEAGMGGVTWAKKPPKKAPFEGWPWISCFQGDLDLTGHRRPISYYRSVVWGIDKEIHLFTRHPSHTDEEFYGNGWHWEEVMPTWTFDEKWINKDVAVVAYGRGDMAIFELNGKVVASVPILQDMARAKIPYIPGILKVQLIKDGLVISTDELQSAGEAMYFQTQVDKVNLHANSMDLSYVRIQLADKNGIAVLDNDVVVRVRVEGCGTLQGLGSGNPRTDENYGTGMRQTYEGSVTAAIRSTSEPGIIKVIIEADNIEKKEICLMSQI